MQEVISKIDDIASTLQSRGLTKLAFALDSISDRLEKKIAGALPPDEFDRLRSKLKAYSPSDKRLASVFDTVFNFFHDTEPDTSLLVGSIGKVEAPNKHSLLTLFKMMKTLSKQKGAKMQAADKLFVNKLDSLLLKEEEIG